MATGTVAQLMSTMAGGFTAATSGALGMIGFNSSTNEIELTLNSEENGTAVDLVFAPKKDMTPFEMIQLTLLMTLMSHGRLSKHENSLLFIRRHNLERHFKFNQP